MQVAEETGKTTLNVLRVGWKLWRLGDYRRWLDWRVADLAAWLDRHGEHGEVRLDRDFDREAARWAVAQKPPRVQYLDESRQSIRLVD